MDVPLFDRAISEEDENFWIIKFWNGWCFVAPKNQTFIRHKHIEMSKPIHYYANYKEVNCETIDFEFARITLGQSGGFMGRQWSYSISIYGIMCSENQIDIIKRNIGSL